MSPTVRSVLAVLALFGSLVAMAGGLHVARKVWRGTAGDTMSVSVMAGLGALIGAIAGAWYAKQRD